MQPLQDSYERLRDSLRVVPRAANASQRDVAWLAGDTLGASRNEQGQLEVFMRGPQLVCLYPNVSARVDHDEWLQSDGTHLEASRLVLPAEGHYDALAAFLLTHLVENGAKENLAQGFRKSEPAISVILETWLAHEEKLIGLSGELLVLRELLRQQAGHTVDVMNAWQGHQHTARDLQLGAVGVEVKTTRRDASRHHINGVRQVEPGHRRDGGHETHLFLVSVGVAMIAANEPLEHAWSLPSLINDILSFLEKAISKEADRDRIRTDFLAKVHSYDDGGWYDHESTASRAMHDRPCRTVFSRTYDMTDEAVSVIRSIDLARFTSVLPETVYYEIDLPKRVRGDINPLVGHVLAVRTLLDIADWRVDGSA